jgi:hypothetical protein
MKRKPFTNNAAFVRVYIRKTWLAAYRYTTAISQLSRAMTDVRHVMKPPSSSQDESPTPSVKMWNREEEENFVLRPRQESTQSEGARRGSSWSWFVAWEKLNFAHVMRARQINNHDKFSFYIYSIFFSRPSSKQQLCLTMTAAGSEVAELQILTATLVEGRRYPGAAIALGHCLWQSHPPALPWEMDRSLPAGF